MEIRSVAVKPPVSCRPVRRFGILLALMASAAIAQGATLRGGSYAWLSRPAEQAPRGAEEWEAFLSIDGGAHYVFRITPHLDLALKSVSWLVPNVDAADARILIRTGDEKNEREFALPQSFSITRDGGRPLPPPNIAVTKPGELGVVQWAEGDRAGTRVMQVVAAVPPGRMESLLAVHLHDTPPVDGPKRFRTLGVVGSGNIAPVTTERANDPSNPDLAVDLLLKFRRQNI